MEEGTGKEAEMVKGITEKRKRKEEVSLIWFTVITLTHEPMQRHTGTNGLSHYPMW